MTISKITRAQLFIQPSSGDAILRPFGGRLSSDQCRAMVPTIRQKLNLSDGELYAEFTEEQDLKLRSRHVLTLDTWAQIADEISTHLGGVPVHPVTAADFLDFLGSLPLATMVGVVGEAQKMMEEALQNQ